MSEAELADIQGVPRKLTKRAGRRLLDEIAASARDDRQYSPPGPPNEGQKSLLKEMQRRVAACAEDLGIAAETVLSKRELSAIIIAGSRKSRAFDGWRAELLGNELRALLP